MAAADIRSLAYQVYKAINEQDIEALERLFDPQIIRHAAGEIGIESAKRAVKSATEKRFVVEDVLADGNKAALRVTVHDASSASDQPLGMILEIFRFENGRVAEIWGAGTMRQPAS